MDRRQEIAANLAAVRERIAAACAAAGRDPGEVTLIAVSKTYPASDVEHLLALGVADIGENRDQEAAPKAAEIARTLANGSGAVRPVWHFIGQLQRNKCKSVVTYADMVHSVDGVELARTLGDQAARRRSGPLDVLIQVSLDDAPGRGGADIDEVPGLAQTIAEIGSLRLRGLMAVAPLGEDPERAFERLRRYIAMFQADHPNATVVSAGMSDDLHEAIASGATHVRIGSALLGKRSALG